MDRENASMLANKIMIIILGIFFLTGCSNVKEDWQKSKKEDKAKTYEQFLEKYPNSTYAVEARNALTETVIIPYFAYNNPGAKEPPLEELKVPEKILSSPVSNIFNNKSTKILGSMSLIQVNGHTIQLANSHYNGKEIYTVKFGKLLCVLAQAGMTGEGFMMTFVLGGTRAQRDAIVDFVSSPKK